MPVEWSIVLKCVGNGVRLPRSLVSKAELFDDDP
jgi:hypothetical protein